jgi:hypothetical protein
LSGKNTDFVLKFSAEDLRKFYDKGFAFVDRGGTKNPKKK